MDIPLLCQRDCNYFNPHNELGKGTCNYEGRNIIDLVFQWQECEYGRTIDVLDTATSKKERSEGKESLKILLEAKSKK
jgi:hypothetical protein